MAFSTAPETEEASQQDASEKIREEQEQISRVQQWWSTGAGPAAAASSAILSQVDEALLSEIVEAGGGYHQILSADRLDGMHRRLGSGTAPALEPLRRALQTRGGAKSQARVVGMLLFKEARALFEQREAPAALPEAAGEEVVLEERWSPARRFACSDAYPEGASMAVRAAPSSKGDIVATLPEGAEYTATGRVGAYLQIAHEGGVAYVLHSLGGKALLVEAVQPLDESWAPARRFVPAESYPPGAQMAVRAAPSREGTQVATLPPGSEYWATGKVGDYLQISMELEGSRSVAYVLHAIGDLTLLVPDHAEGRAAPKAEAPRVQAQRMEGTPAKAAAAAAMAAADAARVAAEAAKTANDDRVVVLEAKVDAQEKQLQALHGELAMLKAQLGAVATAFKPIAIAGA